MNKELEEYRKKHPEWKDVGPTKGQFYAGLAAFIALGSTFMRWLAIKIFRKGSK